MTPVLPLLVALALAAGEPARAQVVHDDPAGAAVIAKNAAVEQLGTGMKFVEGPVWITAEQRLVFSDIPAKKLMQWTAKDGVTELRTVEETNGNTLDAMNRLVSCQHGTRSVVRNEKDGTLTVLASEHDGKKLNSPNDIAVRRDGTIWFTDPTYGLRGREPEQDGNFVYRLDADGGPLTVVAREFHMPNGICFAPDHDRVYIADSGDKQRVGAFAIGEDGTLTNVFWLEGGADGIRCDSVGNLFTTARDGVRVYSAAGKRLCTIKLPEVPANCAFGGDDRTTLFITARTSLYRVQVLVPGAPIPAAKPAAPSKSVPGK